MAAISGIPAYEFMTRKLWPSSQAETDSFFFLNSGKQLHF